MRHVIRYSEPHRDVWPISTSMIENSNSLQSGISSVFGEQSAGAKIKDYSSAFEDITTASLLDFGIASITNCCTFAPLLSTLLSFPKRTDTTSDLPNFFVPYERKSQVPSSRSLSNSSHSFYFTHHCEQHYKKMKLPLIPQHKSKSEPTTTGPLQTIQRKLAQNALTEFKIGFENGEFRSKRDVQSLINTIKDQYLHKLAMDKISCLESIRIGWKLPNFAIGPILQQVVPMLLQQPAQVQHLQLMMNSWVPLPTIQRLVSWHTLVTLDLQSLRIRTRALSDPRPSVDQGGYSSRRHNHRSLSPSSGVCVSSTTKTDDSFSVIDDGFITADDSALAALPYLSPSIKTLKLVDCGLQVHDMEELIQCLQNKRHIQSLSLRHNRRLYMNGWENDLLNKLPFLKALDLSICDLSPVDGFCLAAAFTRHSSRGSSTTTKSGLVRLSVAGNYRIHESIPQLVEACTVKGIRELDCSFCDVQNKCQQAVFNFLATAPEPCSLRSLKMQAVRIKNVAPLIRCIEKNTSLERLILDHPREPYEVSSESMGQILQAVRDNYYLKVFRVDPPWDVDSKVLDEMEHWMTLNRCGRSILVHDSSKYWPLVLANTARLNDIDMLYWMLRNGAEQF